MDPLAEIERVRAECSSRIQRWKVTLAQIDRSSPESVLHHGTFIGIELRAAAIVGLVASLERTVRICVRATLIHLDEERIPMRELSGLLPWVSHYNAISSIGGTTNTIKSWQRYRQLFDSLAETEPARFQAALTASPMVPLAGSTVSSDTLSHLWQVLGIPGDILPSAHSNSVLKKLVQSRNDIAHSNAPLEDVLVSPELQTGRLTEHCETIDRVIDHICLAFRDYLGRRSYRQEDALPPA